jgi:NADH-quinone oxidoreductase subunit A
VGHYFPILIFAVLAAALPLGTILVARAVQRQRPNPVKLEPTSAAWSRRPPLSTPVFGPYFLIAVLFVVFDVETIFLFPWAIMFHKLGLFGLIEMVVFLAILVVGYVYCWKRKALDWA